MPAMIKVFNTQFLIRNMLRATCNVLLGFRKMLKLYRAIQAPLLKDAGGSTISLSATGA